jgi:hypothetical protein
VETAVRRANSQDGGRESFALRVQAEGFLDRADALGK